MNMNKNETGNTALLINKLILDALHAEAQFTRKDQDGGRNFGLAECAAALNLRTALKASKPRGDKDAGRPQT